MGLQCCMGFFLVWDEQELLFWLLVAVASPVAVTGSKVHRLSSYGSQAPEHRLSGCGAWAYCFTTYGVFSTGNQTYVSFIGKMILYH